ncbi:MAG TPA: PIG-L deacetylase family protein [Acidimicrobiales bacterium]|nr:PIG-L deacetylase family protein [Acidimicrobiales bacterium]
MAEPVEMVEDAPARAMAVYAHPDDADVSCGGTMARWAAAGAEVHVVICTSGDKGSSDPAADPAELAGRRTLEAAAASGVLGLAGHHLLGHPDGEIDNDARFRAQLVRLIRLLRPDVVACPDPTAVFFGGRYFNHRDHREVGWATLDAVVPAAASPHYFPDQGPPHHVEAVFLSGTLEPDVLVDISDFVEVKAEALLCHESQLSETGEWLRQVVRQRAEDAGRAAGVRYAEGFRRLRLTG